MAFGDLWHVNLPFFLISSIVTLNDDIYTCSFNLSNVNLVPYKIEASYESAIINT